MNENIINFLKKNYLYVGIALFAVISLLLTIDVKQEETNDIPKVYETDNQFATYIYIDIRGSVLNPGVYKVEDGTRLFQLISLAGGLTNDANELVINQSQLLIDEMFVYVPCINESEKSNSLVDTDGDSILNPKININHASQAQLETLPGIGPATAKSIIDYRDNISSFNSIEDIMDVPGIGEATYNEIKTIIIT